MKISVVIPTCDRPALLARCLEKIRGAEEIIIADDSREDATKKIVAEKFPNARWVRGARCGPAANRNRGARAANGDWLAFVDDDCEPDARWLEAILRTAQNADVVEGKTICPNKRDTIFEEQVENLDGGVLWSCNFAIRRELFERLGGFDEDFLEAAGEDMEFASRVRRSAARIVFEKNALVFHPPRRLTWQKLFRRLTWQWRWALLFKIKTDGSDFAALRITGDLLRETARRVFRREKNWDRVSASRLFLRWLFWPLTLPYLVAWEFCFRHRLKNRPMHDRAPTMDLSGHLLRALPHFRGKQRLVRRWMNRPRTGRRWRRLPGGAKIACEVSSDYEAMVWLRCEEECDLAAMRTVLRTGEVFVDCGANIGLWTLTAARAVGDRGRVFSFEPNGVTFEKLKRNVAANSLEKIVRIHNEACGEREGETTFRCEEEHNISRIVQNEVNATVVRMTTLDAAVANAPVRGIKMDVEGYELGVLRGAEKIIAREEPWICVEFNTRLAGVSRLGDWDVHRHLRERGYACCRMADAARAVRANILRGGENFTACCNLFYFKK